MAKRTLRRLGGNWYFVTSGPKSQAVHALVDGEQVTGDLKGQVLAGGEVFELRGLWDPDDKARAVGSIPRDGNWDFWRRLAAAIERGDFAERPTVPVTPLRDTCRLLRQIDPVDAAAKLAKKWRDAPSDLAKLFLRSVEDFDEYDNVHEDFAPAERGTASVRPESGLFAREIASRAFREGRLVVEGMAPVLSYVAHEISPLRTTGARWEGDERDPDSDIRSKNSSGAGGLDLLLSTDDVFVVGEIKAAGDTSLPFALFQSLMYAAELVPESQRRRLARHHKTVPSRVGNDPKGPYADIVIVFEAAEGRAEELTLALEVAHQLLHGEHPDAARVRRLVRRVAFVEGRIEGGQLSLVCKVTTR